MKNYEMHIMIKTENEKIKNWGHEKAGPKNTKDRVGRYLSSSSF